MGIRIQTREIDVPKDDPFKNDLLGRKESVEVLTHLVDSLEGPCVLAVDAAWGNGKTTFLRIWAQYLRDQGFPVVEFNAWETDFSGDPFVALSTELTQGLRDYDDKPLAAKIADTQKKAEEVLRRAVPSVIRLATMGILDIGPLMEKEVGQALASYAKDRLSEYQEAQKSVKAFRDALENMAETVSKSSENRPLIVVIDELDRCRPSYAVQLLEVAKHLFAVDRIVFVLAVNRSELAHSIRALYGSDFDAVGYLRRFFDVDFRLPDPERVAFIDTMLEATQVKDHFGRTNDWDPPQYRVVRNLLQGFFRAPDLSLRRIAQAIHRLGLVLALLPSNQRVSALAAVAALIVRTIDSDLYYRFVRGEVSDLEVVDRVFNLPGAQNIQYESKFRFEVTIIVAAYEISGAYKRYHYPLSDPESFFSPLLQRYKKLASDDTTPDPERTHAEKVTQLVRNSLIDERVGFRGFHHAVKLVELLSAESH